MSGKRQKLPAKRSRASEAPTPAFDASRFANLSAAERFGSICKNRSFIKEKGFHHPDDFFRKTIEAKGWRALWPTLSPCGDERGAGILRQPRLPRPQKGQGARCIGRLQCGVDQ